MWEILSQSSPFSFSHLCFNLGQLPIFRVCKEVRWLIHSRTDARLGQSLIYRVCKEVRWLIPSGSDVRLGQSASSNLSREVRFLNHSSGRDSNSSGILHKRKCFNLERGGEKEEEEEEEEDGNEEALPPLLFISIVSSNAFQPLYLGEEKESGKKKTKSSVF